MFFAGCSSLLPPPDLGGLYNRAASTGDLHRNPIILIPGVLGSRLVDRETDTIVWGAFGGNFADPDRDEGFRLIAHPVGQGRELAELQDSIYASGVLDRLQIALLGLPVELSAYVQLLRTLGVGGYRDQDLSESGAIDYGDEHFTCFQFPYDWRRDLSENAEALHRFIEDRKRYVQAELKKRYRMENPDVKFDIVAHSMGGLLTRYYLRYGGRRLPEDGSIPPVDWSGAKNVERAVLIGTPSAGSVNGFAVLVEGISFSALFPSYSAALLGTMPGLYQLMPRPRHAAVVDIDNPDRALNIYDPALWQQLGWGLASPDGAEDLERLLPEIDDHEKRRQAALEHQRKSLLRAKQFAASIDVPAKRPEGLDIFLFAGDAVDTDKTIGVDINSGRIKRIAKGPGDGSVLRTSALMDERVGSEWTPGLKTPVDWTNVTFLFADHLGMTREPVFIDNVLYLMLEDPR
jgi:pimeloyl-ACP methyl ester carboxylesterase